MPRRWQTVLVVVALVLCSPHGARAERGGGTTASGDTASATAHFQSGQDLYAAGRYADALVEFRAAHELAPHRSSLFNMARCHQNLGEAAAALARYREALEGTTDTEERRDLETRIEGILSHPVRVFVTSEPPGATVIVDAREEAESGTTPLAVDLPPGPHSLLLNLDGHVPTPHRVVVAVDHEDPVAVTLSPVAEQSCPECPNAEATGGCGQIGVEGLHAHIALTMPLAVPILHSERDARLLAGGGVRAYLTYDHWIVGGRLNINPGLNEPVETADSTGGSTTVVVRRNYSLISGVLDAGYLWAFGAAAFWITGGVAMLLDIERVEELDAERSELQTLGSAYGWGSAGLEAYASSWLSLGIDAGLGLGGNLKRGGFEILLLVTAFLGFHI